MKGVVVLTTPGSASGFGLAGVRYSSAQQENAEEKLLALITEPETGLIIIDETLLGCISEENMKDIEKTWPGVLVVLPSPEQAEMEGEDYALQLIRRAIGYHVRLNV